MKWIYQTALFTMITGQLFSQTADTTKQKVERYTCAGSLSITVTYKDASGKEAVLTDWDGARFDVHRIKNQGGIQYVDHKKNVIFTPGAKSYITFGDVMHRCKKAE